MLALCRGSGFIPQHRVSIVSLQCIKLVEGISKDVTGKPNLKCKPG